MKKTALDDEAEIYQKREEKTEKEKWKQMDRKAKAQYFVDYYLGKLIVAVIIIGIGASLLWHFFKPKDEPVLYAAVIDESLDATKLADQKTFKKLAGDGYFEDVDKFAKNNDLSGYESLYVYDDGESRPYGIALSGAEKYMDMTSYGKHPVFAVAENAQHKKNIAEFLNYLMQK